MCISRLEGARVLVRIQVRCSGMLRPFVSLHGLLNVGIYPEKGMMSQLRREGP
jgi:hypothetical protein